MSAETSERERRLEAGQALAAYALTDHGRRACLLFDAAGRSETDAAQLMRARAQPSA